MKIEDIIKQDSDRLFIIDPECFIIFTGDSIDDPKPFIRIGNWINLPVKSIPLIENVIIPDRIIGNPAYEQFNIHLKEIGSNRYVGSKAIIKRYLNFQNIFGIDLSNVPIVDVETDLPSLSKEKIISDKDTFIGVFYINGNFSVILNDNKVFDLEEVERSTITDVKIHDIISFTNKDTKRYADSGIILFGNNPIFYKNRYFTFYHFPNNYFEGFARLGIDPARVREIIIPNSNLLNITKFIKWKNSKGGRIKLFSDSKEKIDLMQKLFSDVSIIRKDSNGLSFNTGDGINVRNYPGTLNLIITYISIKPAYKEITIAYIKSYTGIQEIFKETLDAIFIPYTIFEKINILFKSVSTPYIIIYDGNKNISKVIGTENIVLYPFIQYEFQKHTNIENIFQSAISLINDRDLASGLIDDYIKSIHDVIFHNQAPGKELSFNEMQDIFNVISILRLNQNSTTDRKLVSLIQKSLYKLRSLVNNNTMLINNKEHFKIILTFYNNSIYEFIKKIDVAISEEAVSFVAEDGEEMIGYLADDSNIDYRGFRERIINDRRRFNELVNMYNKHHKRDKDIPWMDDKFRKKREGLLSENIENDTKELTKSIFRMRLRKITRVLLVLVFTALIFIVSLLSFNYYQRYQERIRIERESRKIEKLIKRYNIHISDKDIYLYADEVAVRNGYERLDFKTLKKKNPDWIFPSNIFILLDKERIVVKKGDTLWGISHKKLMQISIEFYMIIDIIKEKIDKGTDITDDLTKAKKLAFSEKHFKLIQNLLKKTKDEEK
ncbi:MAG: hypothetical protein SVZ03_05060 [Spirochaetota bacterium]|nr:hypothetical protein [Spirochaetota bacterium]